MSIQPHVVRLRIRIVGKRARPDAPIDRRGVNTGGSGLPRAPYETSFPASGGARPDGATDGRALTRRSSRPATSGCPGAARCSSSRPTRRRRRPRARTPAPADAHAVLVRRVHLHRRLGMSGRARGSLVAQTAGQAGRRVPGRAVEQLVDERPGVHPPDRRPAKPHGGRAAGALLAGPADELAEHRRLAAGARLPDGLRRTARAGRTLRADGRGHTHVRPDRRGEQRPLRAAAAPPGSSPATAAGAAPTSPPHTPPSPCPALVRFPRIRLVLLIMCTPMICCQIRTRYTRAAGRSVRKYCRKESEHRPGSGRRRPSCATAGHSHAG